MLRTEDLDYRLPAELIATRPAEPRDSARMMVVYRSTDTVEHCHVRDLPQYLRSDDALVFNTTAVVPARLLGVRCETGGKVEGLFLAESHEDTNAVQWRMLLKAGGRLKPGHRIEWLDHQHRPSGWGIELLKPENGEWLVRLIRVSPNAPLNTGMVLEKTGWTPLPPYIVQARREGQRDQDVADEADRQWYQTVYAADRTAAGGGSGGGGSVAAPTAGLHFTPRLLDEIAAKGVQRIDVKLHVGAGTFKPITTALLSDHRMHAEWFEVSADAVEALRHRAAHRQSSRLIAVGTTSVRTLESLPLNKSGDGGEGVPPLQNWGGIAGMTDLMIASPHDFKLVDGMLTNFHLPRSTLMALVAAMLDNQGDATAGGAAVERLKALYRMAIEERYRFYSYGDAMLILP